MAKDGWVRLILTSTLISGAITAGAHYVEQTRKQQFELKKESIQKKLLVLDGLRANLDLLEQRLAVLKVANNAVASKSSKNLSDKDLHSYAINAGAVVRSLETDVGSLESGGEARLATERLLANVAAPLNQAQAQPPKLETLIRYLDGEFAADKNAASTKIKDVIETVSSGS